LSTDIGTDTDTDTVNSTSVIKWYGRRAFNNEEVGVWRLAF
jgi:hypothetical protein